MPHPCLSQPASRRLRLGVLGLLTGLATLLGGCALQPWVQPYERERLADPVMQFGRAGLIERHRDHVYSVREGARGATGVQGGGCGCN